MAEKGNYMAIENNTDEKLQVGVDKNFWNLIRATENWKKERNWRIEM